MPPTLTWFGGAEVSDLSSGAQFSAVNTSAQISVDATRVHTPTNVSGGAKSWKFANIGTTTYLQFAHATNMLVFCGWFNLDTVPASGFRHFLQFRMTTSAWTPLIGVDVDTGNFAYRNDTTQSLEQLQAYSLDTWYFIQVKINLAANPWIIDIQLGTDPNSLSANAYSAAQAADTMTDVRFGAMSGATGFTVFWDDIAASATSGDWPIGPVACKTHGFTLDDTNSVNIGHFEDDASAAVTSADVSKLTDESDSTFIRQVTQNTSSYVKFPFTDVTSPVPVGIKGLIKHLADTNNTSKASAYLIRTDTSTTYEIRGLPATTSNWNQASSAWRGGSGTAVIATSALTNTQFNAIEMRFGHSDDTNPKPRLLEAALETCYLDVSATTPFSGWGTPI
jgi:hypothetical protein